MSVHNESLIYCSRGVKCLLRIFDAIPQCYEEFLGTLDYVARVVERVCDEKPSVSAVPLFLFRFLSSD